MLLAFCLAGPGPGPAAGEVAGAWRDGQWETSLQNDAIKAVFQAGIPIRIEMPMTGESILSVEPNELPSRLNLFGTSGFDLDTCTLDQEVTENQLHTVWNAPDGAEFSLQWSIESGTGDLILRCAAKTAAPVEDFRYIFFGCDIDRFSLTWADQLGVGHHIRGPQGGRLFIGDPQKDSSPGSQIHPMVALFQQEKMGWVMTGREEKIGPACMMMQGYGTTASIGWIRRFQPPTREPELFEIRLRAYLVDWRPAVDPYIEWMEKEVGYVPLEDQSPSWMHGIRSQAYIRVGDFDGQIPRIREDSSKGRLRNAAGGGVAEQ